MKKILLIISILAISSCVSNVSVSPDATTTDNPFVVVSTGRIQVWPFYIVYDKTTQVMYVMSFVDGGMNFTPLLNPDGSPRLYEPSDY